MAITPLERFTQPSDGTIADAGALGFGATTFHLASGLMGVATGGSNVDANAGNPVHLRTHSAAMHSIAAGGAVGIGNSGPSPTGVSTGQMSAGTTVITVSAGTDLIISSIYTDGTGSASFITLTGGINVAKLQTTTAALFMTLPILLKAGTAITCPQHTGCTGYLLNADSAIGAVNVAISDVTTYTVPANVTFWLYGITNVTATGNTISTLLANSNQVCNIYNGNRATCDNTWPLGQGPTLTNSTAYQPLSSGSGWLTNTPIPFPTGTVLQLGVASTNAFMWGITM